MAPSLNGKKMKVIGEMNFYKLSVVEEGPLFDKIHLAVKALIAQQPGDASTPEDFVESLFNTEQVCDFLIYLSRLPVFSKDFAGAFKSNLDLLATAKKLKYFTNLSLGQNAILLKNMAQSLELTISGMQQQIDLLFQDRAFSSLKVKDYMNTNPFEISSRYLANDIALVSIDPHSVYPTSIYRHCDGCMMATTDSRTIEAVMTTDITTTIKITRGILEPSSRVLAEVYQPLGRCIAVVDDKVESLYGEVLQDYFDAHDIPLTKFVHQGNEINKDIKNVQAILLDMKNFGVARHEPVLIIGGGVISDLGGLATSLYHRNTPYVMLCTSIVSGIDAGPSPRTCCDGYGFKNHYGAYHPPILTLTDRSFWKTLHEGWIRHGIAEIIKMACVKDYSLFLLLEKAGVKLVRTKFGTVGCDDDQDFQDLCDNIVGKAMESYVRSEYGNLWETHQCRPHAFGHTWSPGYELPAGMLHGHAVATGMGYGTYLSYKYQWISKQQFERILSLISNMELALWHPIMDNHDLVISASKKVTAKRGGNLCAPVPKGKIGECGYINDLKEEDIPDTIEEYKAIVSKLVRDGHGVDVHCHDVGLDDPSVTAKDAFIEIGQTPPPTEKVVDQSVPASYQDWIKSEQVKRNKKWEMNVQREMATDTRYPPEYNNVSLFHDVVENYAMAHTSMSSTNIKLAADLTEKEDMFMPCMVGAMESQFLKMQCQIVGAQNCLDIGTFTGMSAIAMAEGIPGNGKVVTLECDKTIADVAQKAFDASSVGAKIDLRVGKAVDMMRQMVEDSVKFDVIFIDADKQSYIEYYELSLQILSKRGIILADNSLCALLYDQTSDICSLKLHQFNQHVKNDRRTEQVVLTVREGVTLIKPVC